MEFCTKIIGICDKVYLFGISEGSLDEIIEAKRLGKSITDHSKRFDPEFEKYHDLFASNPKYKQIILEVCGRKNEKLKI